MDVLVIVGDFDAPARLAARAAHELHTKGGSLHPDLVAELRGRIPREVGVVGERGDAATVAAELHNAGLPVTLYTDDATPAAAGVRVLPVSDRGAPMEVADSLLGLVGNTPLVRLDRVGRDLSCHLLAKLEMLNPGGSVKDRPAQAMIEAAEREGKLHKGGTIVAPTSGNTGVGLAIVAARRRYRCIFTMPDKIAPEKVALLRAYGAEVVVCPTAVAPEHPESYYNVSDRLAAERPGGWEAKQYANVNNPLSHYHSTGPELWRQTDGLITHFVTGVGTGGTISGAGRYLKEVSDGKVRIVGADPEGSVYSGGTGRPYLVEGVGEDFW